MRSIKVEPQEPLDTKWYQLLQKATTGISESFIMLEPDQPWLRAERERFFAANCQINPVLRPRHLDDTFLGRTIHELRSLQTDIRDQELNTYIRDAYDEHIEDHVLTLEMLRASIANDHERFIQKNIELYGMPDQNVFKATCAWIRQDISRTEAAPESALAKYRDAALEQIPDLAGDAAMLIPNDAIFKKVRDVHLAQGGYFDQLFAPHGLPEQAYIDQVYGDTITKQAIYNVGSDYSIKTATDGLWAVLPRSRQVVRPLGYRVDRDYFIGVIAHEVGSHLLEESNGSHQPLQLLRLGLRGYERGNEGRAYLREQIVYSDASVFVCQSSWEYILMLHLAVSLASGLHQKKYTFMELYHCLYALHRFWRERRYPLDTNNEAEACEEAWLLAVRIMKGTDGTGGCYMKDTVYAQGNVECWKLAEAEDPAILLLGDIGKFNIFDFKHLEIVRGLGILPATVN